MLDGDREKAKVRKLRRTNARVELRPRGPHFEGRRYWPQAGGHLDAVVRVRYEERFAIPAVLALLALAIELCIGDGRGKRIAREGS